MTYTNRGSTTWPFTHLLNTGQVKILAIKGKNDEPSQTAREAGMKGFGKSEKGNFEVVGQADGPDGQKALLIGCKVHMDEAKAELFDYLRKVKKHPDFNGFNGFVFKKQF